MRTPRVQVAPADHPWCEKITAAVRRGGAVVGSGEAAEAVIWLGKDDDDLRALLHPGVRWVQLPAAGVEPWVASGLVDSERTFTAAKGVYAGPVAEHAMALILAAAKRIPECACSRAWLPELAGRQLSGSTVAIVGAGGIGLALIRRLSPFGAAVVAVTRSGRRVPGATRSVALEGLAAVWPVADYVVLSAPATAETRHLVGRAELAVMQPHAWLVNVARGSLVDTDALVEALRDGQIGGAALDVTEPEPLPEGHPLWHEPRALITPHVANTKESHLTLLTAHVEDNVRRFVEGRQLLGVIDVDAGY